MRWAARSTPSATEANATAWLPPAGQRSSGARVRSEAGRLGAPRLSRTRRDGRGWLARLAPEQRPLALREGFILVRGHLPLIIRAFVVDTVVLVAIATQGGTRKGSPKRPPLRHFVPETPRTASSRGANARCGMRCLSPEFRRVGHAAGEGMQKAKGPTDCARVRSQRGAPGPGAIGSVLPTSCRKSRPPGFPSPFLLCGDPRLFTVIPNRGLSRGEGPLSERELSGGGGCSHWKACLLTRRESMRAAG